MFVILCKVFRGCTKNTKLSNEFVKTKVNKHFKVLVALGVVAYYLSNEIAVLGSKRKEKLGFHHGIFYLWQRNPT